MRKGHVDLRHASGTLLEDFGDEPVVTIVAMLSVGVYVAASPSAVPTLERRAVEVGIHQYKASDAPLSILGDDSSTQLDAAAGLPESTLATRNPVDRLGGESTASPRASGPDRKVQKLLNQEVAEPDDLSTRLERLESRLPKLVEDATHAAIQAVLKNLADLATAPELETLRAADLGNAVECARLDYVMIQLTFDQQFAVYEFLRSSELPYEQHLQGCARVERSSLERLSERGFEFAEVDLEGFLVGADAGGRIALLAQGDALDALAVDFDVAGNPLERFAADLVVLGRVHDEMDGVDAGDVEDARILWGGGFRLGQRRGSGDGEGDEGAQGVSPGRPED